MVVSWWIMTFRSVHAFGDISKPHNKTGMGDIMVCIVMSSCLCFLTCSATAQKATIHQVTTTLATSKNALFPGHNLLLITGTDDPSLPGAQAIIRVLYHG